MIFVKMRRSHEELTLKNAHHTNRGRFRLDDTGTYKALSLLPCLSTLTSPANSRRYPESRQLSLHLILQPQSSPLHYQSKSSTPQQTSHPLFSKGRNDTGLLPPEQEGLAGTLPATDHTLWSQAPTPSKAGIIPASCHRSERGWPESFRPRSIYTRRRRRSSYCSFITCPFPSSQANKRP